MFKGIVFLLLVSGMFILLQACIAGGGEIAVQFPPASTQSVFGSQAAEVPQSTVDQSLPESAGVEQEFSLEDAKSAFAAFHPDAEITVAKREGHVYYLEGWEGNVLTKMKFAKDNGTVLLDKTIAAGHSS